MMSNKDSEGDKPYACPVPGCKKRYKNVNGIKYHARHGHRKEARYIDAYIVDRTWHLLWLINTIESYS